MCSNATLCHLDLHRTGGGGGPECRPECRWVICSVTAYKLTFSGIFIFHYLLLPRASFPVWFCVLFYSNRFLLFDCCRSVLCYCCVLCVFCPVADAQRLVSATARAECSTLPNMFVFSVVINRNYSAFWLPSAVTSHRSYKRWTHRLHI